MLKREHNTFAFLLLLFPSKAVGVYLEHVKASRSGPFSSVRCSLTVEEDTRRHEAARKTK